MHRYVNLLPGDPAPWFEQRSPSSPRFKFDTVGGRYAVLCFYGSASDAHAQAAFRAVLDRSDFFTDKRGSFYGVSLDPADEAEARVSERNPGYRQFWDFDARIAKLYGAVPVEAPAGEERALQRRRWVVLDPMLRVRAILPFERDGGDIGKLTELIDALPPVESFNGVEIGAPILYLPGVFEPELCEQLIAHYESKGGVESGFMREREGRTVLMHDPKHKRRRDVTIEDRALAEAAAARIFRRVVPEIRKAHQFEATQIERFIVSCYAAEDAAHFNRHRDNTTKGTAHRRFAVSINLNEDFEGGAVGFPEFGPRRFKAPAGGAVVFSCSLLHSVSKVTVGKRYAFLPFLYDEAAKKIREENAQFLDGTQEA